MNKIEHKKTQYPKSSLKRIFLYLIFTLLVFQNSIGQESIVIPDISIEIESDTFSFDKDAIPDFKIEPIKEEPTVVIEKVEKVLEKYGYNIPIYDNSTGNFEILHEKSKVLSKSR